MRTIHHMSKKSIESDLARVDRLTDAEIDYSDIPALDESFLTNPATRFPQPPAASPTSTRPTTQRKTPRDIA